MPAFRMLCVCSPFLLLTSLVSADVRDRAVLRVTFNEVTGSPEDVAKSGKVKDAITVSKDASRVPSAFVTTAPGQSLLLDPAKNQQVIIASSEDISRADAVTISGFFASLHPLNDTTFRALFAKRSGNVGSPTNYGINYQLSADNFQVYIHDGTAYRVVNFSANGALGYRRRVHISASLDMSDAPGADADPDADDLRIRLFINGQPLKPTNSSGAIIDGNVSFFPDVALSKSVSDTALTIGSSYLDGELTRLLCDDFCLFAEALTDADARALFDEAAGASAAEIAAEKGATQIVTPAPQVARLSQHAAQIGQTTRITVYGQNLEDAQLFPETAGITTAAVSGSNGQAAIFDVTVDPMVVSGRYQIRCVTPRGVSQPAIISYDRVPTQPDGTFTEAAPATTFPIAVSGVISGTEQKRVWFQGTAGQKIVADLEAKRIGSRLDPVVEIRNQSGGPLAIQWQQADLKGDARAAAVIPVDGLYFAEVHDLQFAAPGASSWRLFLGDLPPSAIAFPSAISAADTGVRTAGKDAVSESVAIRKTGGGLTAANGASILPIPALRVEPGTHVVEPLEGTFAAEPVDATFTAAPFPALLISGRIAAPKEIDMINIKVTAGQTLHFSTAARQIGSPLRGLLMLYNGENLVAQNDGEAGLNDAEFAFAVPDGVAQLQLRIRDVNLKGSADSVYRIQVSRTDRQAFLMTTRDGALRLPVNGSVPLRVSVIRQSPSFRYTGPIRLTTQGSRGLTLVPDVIPASDQDQEVLLMVTRTAALQSGDSPGQGLRIEGRTEGAEPAYATALQVLAEGIPGNALTVPGETLVTGPADAVQAAIVPDGIPPILFRGLTTSLPVRVLPLAENIPGFVRFEMLTTEPLRKEDPNRPDSPNKPIVRLNDFQFGTVSQGVIPLKLIVPLDTPSSVIEGVLVGELVAQPLAVAAGPGIFSAPLRLAIENAAAITAPAEPVKGKKATAVPIPVTVKRHPLYLEAVSILIDGLPAGFTAVPVSIPADQTKAALSIAIPEAAGAGEVPNLTLRVLSASGEPIQTGIPVRLVVE